MDAARPVGIIGLGELGNTLARRLVTTGQRVLVYDLDREARQSFPLVRPAGEVAPGLTDLGDECDIVLSAVPDIAALREASIGSLDRPGFAQAMRPGSVIVHFGSGPYRDVQRFTGQLGMGGIGLIDVLTCVEPGKSQEGRFDMLVGGFDDLVERVRPTLQAFGSVARVGATGTATGLAALRGYVRAARLIALSEALLIGKHAGIAPETLSMVFDGPVAAGPECRTLALDPAASCRALDLETTCRSVADAVAFSERIGVSGECVAFARDMLSDAIVANSGGDESTLVRHFAALAAADH